MNSDQRYDRCFYLAAIIDRNILRKVGSVYLARLIDVEAKLKCVRLGTVPPGELAGRIPFYRRRPNDNNPASIKTTKPDAGSGTVPGVDRM